MHLQLQLLKIDVFSARGLLPIPYITTTHQSPKWLNSNQPDAAAVASYVGRSTRLTHGTGSK